MLFYRSGAWSGVRRVLLPRVQTRFLANGARPDGHGASSFFSDRTFGIVALLVSVPAAAYIWKRHSASKHDASAELREKGGKEWPPRAHQPGGSTLYAKYLIVGGGTAAFSAIQAIRESDSTAEIVVVGREDHAPYLRPPLSKELWFSPSRTQAEALEFTDWHGSTKRLDFEPDGFYAEHNVRLLLGCEVVDFDAERREARLADGRVVAFDKALLATGASPRRLDVAVPPSMSDRITTFRDIADFRRLYRLLQDAPTSQRVVVVGGGFLGSELAVAMSRIAGDRGHVITQVFPEEGHMAQVFPKYLSQWTMEKVTGLGVKIRAHRSIVAIEEAGERDGGVVLVLDDGERLVADQVVVAAGVDPNLGFVHDRLSRDAELGGLLADEHLQVARGVFAAGDVVSYVDGTLECRRRTEHFDHAVFSGRLAGRNMAATGAVLEPYTHLSMFWSDLGPEVGYEAVGIVDSSLTTVGVWGKATTEDSPHGTTLDPSDIRVVTIGQTSLNSPDPLVKPEAAKEIDRIAGTTEHMETLTANDALPMSPAYGKGVVFYLKDRRIVGMLLFNLFNRVNLARDILRQRRGVDDISTLVHLFNIHEAA